MYVGEKKPVVLVDGWDVHFFKDLNNLVSEIIFNSIANCNCKKVFVSLKWYCASESGLEFGSYISFIVLNCTFVQQ